MESRAPSFLHGSHHCECCSARMLSVCAVLSADELLEFDRLSQHAHYASRETVFLQGEPACSVYNLTEGVLRLYKLLPDGRRQIVGFALAGDFLGMGAPDCYGFSADAISPAVVCRFPRNSFLRLIEAKPHFLRRLNEFVNRDLSLAQNQMLLLGRLSADEKIAAFILNWVDRMRRLGQASATIPLPMGRQDIADYLGLTIETVSRTFTKLERDKTIVIVPHGIRLLDGRRMEALAAA